MADQYSLFQANGPSIDVNLFPNAMTQGIAAGNAQKSTVGAIAEGVGNAITSGMQAYGGAQGIRANEAALAISEDKGVQDAKKQQILLEGQKAKLESEVLEQDREIALEVAKSDLEVKKQTNLQKLGDFANIRLVDEILGGLSSKTDPVEQQAEVNRILQAPGMLATMARDTQFGLATLKRMETTGLADPVMLQNAREIIDQEEIAKSRNRIAQAQEVARAKAAEKDQEKFDGSIDAISSLSDRARDLLDINTNKNLNVNKFELVPKGTIKYEDGVPAKDADGNIIRIPKLSAGGDTYALLYGNEVAADDISKDDYSKYNRDLYELKKGAASRDAYRRVAKVGEADNTGGSSNGQPTKVREENLGLAEGSPSQVPGPEEIYTQVQTGYEQAKQRAAQNGQIVAFSKLRQRGNVIAGSRVMPSNQAYITGSQATPTPASVLPQTRPTPTPFNTPGITAPMPTLTPSSYTDILKGVTGRQDISLDVDTSLLKARPEDFKTIANMEAFAGKPALIKAIGLVESRGNPNAKSINISTGVTIAAGIMQFTKAAAKDAGLATDGTSDERLDPAKAVPAAVRYVETQYKNVQRGLLAKLGEKGMIKVDPRLVLASYNGGYDAVRKAIAAGNTTWDTVKDYIERNNLKSPSNMKENFEYADKVITASIPFIVGGNESDDSYITALKNADIIGYA